VSHPPSLSVAAVPVRCPHLGAPGESDPRGSTATSDATYCHAFGDGVALSVDQRRLVCLTERHTACRRYVLSSTGSGPASGIPERRLLGRPAVLAALVCLAVAVILAVGYLFGGGDLTIGASFLN
jgi:hypothetical protein